MTAAIAIFPSSAELRSSQPHLLQPGLEHFALTVDDQGEVCTLTLSGSLDVDSAIAFESQLEQLVFGEFGQIVLDVGGLDHLDDAGSNVLRKLGEIAAANGTPILLRDKRATVIVDATMAPGLESRRFS